MLRRLVLLATLFAAPAAGAAPLPFTGFLDLLVALAERGMGVTRLPDWAVRPAIAARRLTPLLTAWCHDVERERPALFAVHAADPGKDRLRRSFLAALEDVARAGDGNAFASKGDSP